MVREKGAVLEDVLRGFVRGSVSESGITRQ